VPFRLWERGLHLVHLIGEGGRSGGLGQYPQPRALLRALTYDVLDRVTVQAPVQVIEKLAPGSRVAQIEHGL
jgi:hypothetical protein